MYFIFYCTGETSVYVKRNSVTIPYTTSDSWTILSPIELSIKQKIEAIGTPLKEWNVKINRGILTGCNDAFIISGEKRNELLLNCKTDCERKATAEIIRPILRGKDIRRYGYSFANQYLIVSHNGYRDDKGNEILPVDIKDYPAIKAHLDEYLDIISVRTDKGVTPYNLRNCAYMDDFSKQKIVWGNLNLTAQYALTNEVIFVNAPSPIITPGSEYLLAFLNSSVGDWWIKLLGVGRSGGFIEYKPMFVETFPVPLPNNETNKRIMDIVHVRQSVENAEEIEHCEKKINQMIYSIYCFKEEEIAVIEDFNINPEIII